MTGERPIAAAGGAQGRRARPSAGRLCALLLAGTALAAALDRPAVAQGSPDSNEALSPNFEAGNPLAKRDANRRFGLDTGGNGLPALSLRGGGLSPSAGNGLGGVAGGGQGAGDAGSGDGSGDGAGAGLGGGAGVSRLPRVRPGLQPISGISGAPGATSPSLLRQRAAPPRRIGSATQALTRRSRTQSLVTDLRLTPMVQSPVSGVPLAVSAATTVPLPAPIPLLGLNSPARLLLDTTSVGRRPDEADPAYAPLGIRLGTFTVLPAFTQSVGYDSNPDQTTPRSAKGSFASRSEGEMAFRSDWSSSAFAGEMRGSYSAFPDNEAASRPNASGATRLRVDIDRDTRFDLETRFLLDTQRSGSPDIGAAAKSRPIYATYGATAGITETFNRLQLSLRGTVDRQVFEDAQLSDGTTLIQSDRNANQYGVRLRAAYEISPTITPFVETILDTRIYDTPVDTSGYRRDSDGIGVTGGASITLSRFLAAEISGGLQHRAYVDHRLRSITAPILTASLIWQVSPLTTVRFNQTTGVIETSVAGSSGVFTDIAAVEVQHELLRNLSITLGGSYISSTYQGSTIRETGFSALGRLDYRFNRWLTLRGSYVYQQIDSTARGSSFNDNIFLLGMRVNP